MLLRKLVISATIQTIGIAAALFLAAGTLDWWEGWVLLGLMVLGTVMSIAALYPDHKDLIEERMKPIFQKGQPLVDRYILVIFLVFLVSWFLFIPIDVFRLHAVLGSPPTIARWAGLAMFIAGWLVVHRTMETNTFASPVVKHLTGRHHRVVDTGVYSVVRHPMYSGAIVLLLGIPLWLGSNAATLLALALSAVLAIRCVLEERFLRRELAGYGDYMKKVRYRLIPGVW